MTENQDLSVNDLKDDGRRSILIRLWEYQKERFPLVAHGILIGTISSSALCFSAFLRGADPSSSSLIIAFVISMLFYLELRIADEFKDFEEDSLHRPYRPVPRGLVTLSELSGLFVVAAAIQFVIAYIYNPLLFFAVAPVWLYLGLMTKEFFVHDWLKAHHVIYVLSHMLIVPMIDMSAAACDWANYLENPPVGFYPFLLVSFTNGMVFEFGRKLRAKEAEEDGVETYTALWGAPKAVMVWLTIMLISGLFAMKVALVTGQSTSAGITLGIIYLTSVASGFKLIYKPFPKIGKVIEGVSVLWALALYFFMGIAPFVLN